MSDTPSVKSKLTYFHKVLHQSIKNGKSTTYEETVIEGPRGVSIKYFNKDDSGTDKITISGSGNKFVMKSADGEKTLSKEELLNELKSNKKLKFASEFAKSQKGGASAKKSSKKSSKKVSKKVSKKSSKKVSKKSSKRASKKSSKKVSKKSKK